METMYVILEQLRHAALVVAALQSSMYWSLFGQCMESDPSVDPLVSLSAEQHLLADTRDLCIMSTGHDVLDSVRNNVTLSRLLRGICSSV